jgi:multiple sugar transport system permease protein
MKKQKKLVSYAKWGYIFLIPFFTVFIIFNLIPLVSTFYNSFFENYEIGLIQVGPTPVGLENFKTIFTDGDLGKYFTNTMIMWALGFVPQMFFSLLLAVWFTNSRLRLKGTSFFKTVIYMPNLIMASAFAMLFFALFSDIGPVNNILARLGIGQYRFLAEVAGTRGLVAFMNFLMWTGNTTIILMSGIMGIDESLFEAARIDGASSWRIFWGITMPLLRPITAYVLITSLIGGLQMFDVPQILTNGGGSPDRTSMTLIMYLNKHLYSHNYGMAGALSVILFVVTGILSMIVYTYTMNNYDGSGSLSKKARAKRKAEKKQMREQKKESKAAQATSSQHA